jgi:outer membrane protein assembly factor BamD
VLKKIVATCFMFALIVIIGCSGRSPEASWTAEEYFGYAKELYDDEDYFEATNDFTIVILRYAGSAIADSAQFYLGMSHYMLAEFIISAAEFSKLVNNMTQSPLVPDAQFMLAMSYYEMSPRAALDQEYTIKAMREFQLFLEDFPTHEKREDVEKKLLELREKMAQKAFMNADLYRKMLRIKSSLIYYDIVLERYYDTTWADDAMVGKAEAFIDMGEYDKAREQLVLAKNKFPDTELTFTIEKLMRKVSFSSDDEENYNQ